MNIRIEESAQRVLNTYWHGAFPVDPAGIATAMGLDVRVESPFAQPSILNGASGMYRRSPSALGRPEVIYSASEPPVRQRFTIAHEIGHHVLGHGDAFRDDKQTFNVYNHDPREVEANAFAAALLMPQTHVLSAFRAGKASDVSGLATTFGVSEVAMLYRLKNLGVVRA
jgi:Zn-dependent peptidase ImmA (M78 family)